MSENLLWFENIGINDIPKVGGKNASLGEMIANLSSLGVIVPSGFATTADAFHRFLDSNQLTEKIHEKLSSLDENDIAAIQAAGSQIRQWIEQARFPEQWGPRFAAAIFKTSNKLAKWFGRPGQEYKKQMSYQERKWN